MTLFCAPLETQHFAALACQHLLVVKRKILILHFNPWLLLLLFCGLGNIVVLVFADYTFIELILRRKVKSSDKESVGACVIDGHLILLQDLSKVAQPIGEGCIFDVHVDDSEAGVVDLEVERY